MDFVRAIDVHKFFERKYGAPTLRTHVDRKDRDRVDPALAGVTFVAGSGEAVAVLGRRRSGKSTLISVINGLYQPDRGTILVRGKPTGPIAMGVGFAPSLSTRDNIPLNAQLLGLSRRDLDHRWDSILSFAQLKPAELGYPLRELTPKSRQQLAYSIMVHVEPEVVLADGAVVVGDKEFREKSLERLEELRERGHALVLATKSRDVIRRLCSRALVLDAGRVVFDGDVREGFRTLRRLKEQ